MIGYQMTVCQRVMKGEQEIEMVEKKRADRIKATITTEYMETRGKKSTDTIQG